MKCRFSVEDHIGGGGGGGGGGGAGGTEGVGSSPGSPL